MLTSSEVAKYVNDSRTHHLYEEHQKTVLDKESLIQNALFIDYRLAENPNPKPKTEENQEVEEEKVKPPPPPPPSIRKKVTPLNYNLKRPPNNSRLNLYHLFYNIQKHTFYYETTATLIRNLYGDLPFFQEIPNAELKILDALIAQKEEAKEFSYPDELASLDLGNPQLQKLLVHLFKGGEDCPSLLNFITFDSGGSSHDKKVNFMFASKELLHAMVPTISKELTTLQEHYWMQIRQQEDNLDLWKNRTALKADLSADFEQIVQRANLDFKSTKDLFDFSLGKLGTILFIEDSATGICMREKHVKKVRAAK